MPWAMLSGTYEPVTSGSLEIRVGHTGELSASPDLNCVGLLGRALAIGLPEDFALAVADSLHNFAPESNRAGLIVVQGGAYDPVNSSRFAFSEAATLLKWAALVQDVSTLRVHHLARFLSDIESC